MLGFHRATFHGASHHNRTRRGKRGVNQKAWKKRSLSSGSPDQILDVLVAEIEENLEKTFKVANVSLNLRSETISLQLRG